METKRDIALRMRGEKQTYQKIADHLGVTRQRAHQLVNDEPANRPRGRPKKSLEPTLASD